MHLDGKVALVTGGGRRVGRAVVLALAAEGARLVVHYGRSADAAGQTVAEARALGAEAEAVPADLAHPEAIAGLFETVADRFGRLDVLVNSAASFQRQAFDAISLDEWEAVMAVNLRAPFLCTQHAARIIRSVERPAGETGLVVNLADLSGIQAWRGYAHHGVSKAALLHLTRVGARELAPAVRVCAVVPGAVLPPTGTDPDGEAWRRIGQGIPLGRPGTPDDVARAVVFLAGSDYITGAILHVDGGAHLIGPGRRA